MIINTINQPNIGDIVKEPIDLVLCSSGYETRSSFLAPELSTINGRLVVIGHEEYQDHYRRKKNDRRYDELGYESIVISGNSANDAHELLNSLFDSIDRPSCKVLIDISSMTGAWYGAFVHSIVLQDKFDEINAYFAYVPAQYKKRGYLYPPHNIVGPVNGFAGFALADKPTTLLIGLGANKSRALGIKEALDPLMTYAFFTSPAIDEEYIKAVHNANNDLFEVINTENVLTYPILDTVASYSLLESLCTGLISESRVVLTSIGPKIFGLYCFLLATKYPEISVWRISAGSHGRPIDSLPSENVLLFEVNYRKG